MATAGSITSLTAVASAGPDPVAEGGGDGGAWVRCSASESGSGSSCGGGSSNCGDTGLELRMGECSTDAPATEGIPNGERCC